MDIYTLTFLFFIYAVLGWAVEEVFALVKHGKIVNRGFLKGPLCPIYGFGMVIIILCLSPIKDWLPLLFIGSAVLTTLLELVTGYVLEKFFHTKWWDYSDMHFNFRGYICLTFSILWGLAGVFIMDIVQPAVMDLIVKIPRKTGYIILSAALIILAVDLVTTIISMTELGKSLAGLEALSEKAEDFRRRLEENRDERREERTEQLEQLRSRMEQLSDELHRKHRRFLNAFPHFERARFDHSGRMEKLKETIEKIKSEYDKK
ncbi:MAG: putative ABC transporter permease [Oscillospiraceae bacterium]